MSGHLQATLDTILEKVALLEGRFDKLLTQSLCNYSESAHAHEGEINLELTRRAETVAKAVLSLDQKIGSLENIYPVYGPLKGEAGIQTSQGEVVQQGGQQFAQQGGQQRVQQDGQQQFIQKGAQQFEQHGAQVVQQGAQVVQQGAQVVQQGAQQIVQQGQQVTQDNQVVQGARKTVQKVVRSESGETLVVTEEVAEVAVAPQQSAAVAGEVAPSGFPKLEKTKEKLLKEIKRVVAGPNGERKIITVSAEEAQAMADAGQELIGEELTEEEAEQFYAEMLQEAEAEMGALEMSLDDYQNNEMSIMETPPEGIVDFANQAAEYIEKLMLKITGMADDVGRLPKFRVTDEEYMEILADRIERERKAREEQRAKDKKARRVGFGEDVDIREFEGDEDEGDDFTSEYGSEFSEGSEASSSMFSEGMASEVPEGWEWNEELQEYVFIGGEGAVRGKYVYVEGQGYFFVPEGEGEGEGEGLSEGATGQGAMFAGAGGADGADGAGQFISPGGEGKKMSFKKKKKKTDDDDDDDDEEAARKKLAAAGAGAAEAGSDAWASEMSKKKNKAKRKKSKGEDKKGASEAVSYDEFKPKLLDKVPWEQPPPGVRPKAPVKKHDAPLPKDSKIQGVKPAIRWILEQPGPFCTTRMVYRNSKKTTRPLYIEKAFEDLHNYSLQGLVVGMLFTVKGNSLANTKCFMKCAPAFISKRYLREFGIDIEDYRQNYLGVDNHASKDPYWFELVDRVKEVHPWIDDFPVDVAYGNVEGMTKEQMLAALKERHKEFLINLEAERLELQRQLVAKSDYKVDESGNIVVKRKFKGTAPGPPHMPKHSWADED